MLFGILGEEIKVDVISVNHDFTLRKKKERKKINVFGTLVCLSCTLGDSRR